MTTPTNDDELPILTRRRIEAAILAPVHRILVRELGEQRAREILTEAIREDSRAQGARLAQREPGGSNLRTFIDLQDLWKADDALQTETLEATEEFYSYDVHRCRYAETYHEMGLGDIGELLSCTRDFEFPHGYDPSITLTRTQTIMSGASHCDFRYRRPKGAPNAHVADAPATPGEVADADAAREDSGEVAHVAAEERDR